jgi:hypothetical protein
MVRMQVRNFGRSLTSCWSKERCDETAFHKMTMTVTHLLLIIGIEDVTCLSQMV